MEPDDFGHWAGNTIAKVTLDGVTNDGAQFFEGIQYSIVKCALPGDALAARFHPALFGKKVIDSPAENSSERERFSENRRDKVNSHLFFLLFT